MQQDQDFVLSEHEAGTLKKEKKTIIRYTNKASTRWVLNVAISTINEYSKRQYFYVMHFIYAINQREQRRFIYS